MDSKSVIKLIIPFLSLHFLHGGFHNYLIPSARLGQTANLQTNAAQVISPAGNPSQDQEPKQASGPPNQSTQTKKLPPNGVADQASFKGRVIDRKERGIANAQLSILVVKAPTPETRVAEQEHYFTDEHGYFQLPQQRGLHMQVIISAKGFESRQVFFPLRNPNEMTRLQLTPGGDLRIMVRDEFNKPLMGATVICGFENYQQTDKNGSVQLRQLQNPAFLDIEAPGFNTLRKRFLLQKETAIVTLLKDGHLTGKVLDDEAGLPVREFTVTMLNDAFFLEEYGATKDQNFHGSSGVFTLEHLSRDDPEIFISAPGYFPFSFRPDVDPYNQPDKPIEIRLGKQGYFLSGRVLDIQGQGIANPRITLFIGRPLISGLEPNSFFPRDTNGDLLVHINGWLGHQIAYGNEAGYFKIGPVPKDHYLALYIEAENYAPNFLKQAQAILPEKRHDLEFHLQKQGALKIHIGHDSYPGTRTILVNNQDQSQYQRIYDLKQGQRLLHVKNINPGTIILSFYATPADLTAFDEKRLTREDITIEVMADTTHEAKIGFSDRRTLSGRVLIEGIPATEKLVFVESTKWPRDWVFQKTDRNGYFKFTGLKPGHYQVMSHGDSASSKFGQRQRIDVQLEDDQIDLEFDFPKAGKVFGRFPQEPPGTQVNLDIDYKIGPNSTSGYQDGRQISADGYFEFLHTPVGTFDLLIQETFPKPSLLILTDIQMPEDGSDLDLGDLYRKPGKLNLTLETPSTLEQGDVTVYWKDPTSGKESTLARLSSKNSSEAIAGLPLGALELYAEVGQGYRVTPEKQILEIRPENLSNISFRVEPQTSLVITPNQSDPELLFLSAFIRHESTDSYWRISSGDKPEKSSSHSKPFLSASSYYISAIGVQEGWWEVLVINTQGHSVKRRVQLVKGSGIQLVLNEEDFKQVI